MSNVELLDQFKSWLLSKKNNSEITEATYQSFLNALGNNDLSSADSQTVSKYIAKIFDDLSEDEIIEILFFHIERKINRILTIWIILKI